MSDPYAIIAKADKKAAPLSGFSSFFSGNSNYRFEEAADLYMQAANLFRLQKNGKEAGKTFEKAADCQIKADSRDEAANTLVEAFKAYRQEDPAEAARVLDAAITAFSTRGQFRRAANYKMDVGTLYETELADPVKAIAAYEEAGDWYSGDQAEALANKAFLKAADLSAIHKDYLKAAKIYETVAKGNLNNNLTKWSLKDYFLKAGLCYLAGDDTVGAQKALDQYLEWDPSFGSTREYKLLADVIACVTEGDNQTFADKVYEYDQFSKLDKWKTTVLLEIKNKIVNAEDDLL